jgi:hypothetical protein
LCIASRPDSALLVDGLNWQQPRVSAVPSPRSSDN